MERADEQGWRISEVERLTGLSRRDIQRCCYMGKGGVGILSPKGGSWGRRTYDVHDLATLFVVAEYRKRGLTLPQVRETFERHGNDAGLTQLLDEECERCRDELAELLGRYVRAHAFRAALGNDETAALAGLFHKVATVQIALHPEGQTLDDLLFLPGMETLVELWLGRGSYEQLSARQ